ncbi:condensation domain-containing protein [Streptomyces albipurpureus]|uniref:Condensation domain-containing protein n=1 Tax=Streptomyces albipurpureus TaxID=2897419 RepID=A0ABT0V023_9ACTN|nr:condensation domain-containing protein [Streptomyces sp. CWNU-1]MCM2392756.1 condensation domain-containing protein [Streptomyces sp. CWNU-1]
MSHATLTTERPLELTAAQAHVLAAQCADPNHAAYNVGQYIELTGPVDPDVLQDALRHTLGEAPGLHLRLRDMGGRLLQEPVPFDAAHWRLRRLDTTGAADPTAAAVEIAREQLACPPRMDLLVVDDRDAARRSAAPALMGAVLVRVGHHRHLLFQYFHQLAVDGYGVTLLTRRIAEVYTARMRGTPLPDSPFTQVSALVAAERSYRESPQYGIDRAHWAARYADGPRPTSFLPASAPPSDTVLRHTIVLDRRTSLAISATADASRATWAEAVTAAVAVQLHLDTGTQDAVLALYAMARSGPGTLRVPGMAVNTLPVRVALDGGDTFGTLLVRTAAEFAAIRAHQRFRGETIARELWPGQLWRGREDGRLPGPLLNLRPFDTEVDFAGVPGHVVTLASGPVDGLSLSAVRYADGRLRLDFDGNPALYDDDSLTRHARRCTEILGRLCAEPERSIATLTLSDELGSAQPPKPDGALTTAVDRSPLVEREEERGELPLLPCAHRLRDAGAAMGRLSDSTLWEVPAGLSASALRAAVARLARVHPALRLRLHRVDGVSELWTQEVLPSAVAPAVVDPTTVRRVDTSSLVAAELSGRIAVEARRAVAALDVWAGAVLRAVWFDAGPARPGRLLLVAHRCSVDDISWQLLVPQLASLHAALQEGHEPPGLATAGLRSWSETLLREAHGRQRTQEMPYWLSLFDPPPPIATPQGRTPSQGVSRVGPELLTTVATTATTGGAADALDGAVLTALALVAADEPRLHGDDRGPGLLLEREVPDPARPPHTIGWLTTVHPIRIAPPGPVPTAGVSAEQAAPALRHTAGALASVPGGGRGYEQLRHLNPQSAALLARTPRALVRYRRRTDAQAPGGVPGWAPAPAAERAALHPAPAAPPITGPVELTATVSSARSAAGSCVTLRWRWSGALFTDEEARLLTARLTEMIADFLTTNRNTLYS